MAYSENSASRIRSLLFDRDDVVEKKMFGGIAFMVSGSMACGIIGEDLMVRVREEDYEEALTRPHARLMDFTGRPLRGFVLVEPEGVRTTSLLKKWLVEAINFATSPEQMKKASAARSRKK